MDKISFITNIYIFLNSVIILKYFILMYLTKNINEFINIYNVLSEIQNNCVIKDVSY